MYTLYCKQHLGSVRLVDPLYAVLLAVRKKRKIRVRAGGGERERSKISSLVRVASVMHTAVSSKRRQAWKLRGLT